MLSTSRPVRTDHRDKPGIDGKALIDQSRKLIAEKSM
jgi:hypothetical protein